MGRGRETGRGNGYDTRETQGGKIKFAGGGVQGSLLEMDPDKNTIEKDGGKERLEEPRRDSNQGRDAGGESAKPLNLGKLDAGHSFKSKDAETLCLYAKRVE